MTQHDDLWREINNLIQLLRQLRVTDIVADYYNKFNNPAPPKLIEQDMEKLQKRLDKAPKIV